jgi:hypothetical protein
MSGSGRNAAPVVQREYRTVPDACEKAIELLLKGHTKKEGGPPTAPEDDVKGSNAYAVTSKCSR